MARALVIKVNPYMHNESLEEIRQEVLRQYNAGGVIVISKFYEVTEVEFDSVRVEELGECQPDTEQPKKIPHDDLISRSALLNEIDSQISEILKDDPCRTLLSTGATERIANHVKNLIDRMPCVEG